MFPTDLTSTLTGLRPRGRTPSPAAELARITEPAPLNWAQRNRTPVVFVEGRRAIR